MALRKRFSATLVAIVTASLLLFGTVAPANAAPSNSTVVARILADTNAARTAAGLRPLTLDAALSSVATTWSKAQHTAGSMSHNPRYAQQIPVGWRAAAENVAMGYSYTAVTPAWLRSSGHRKNILGASFTHVGIGYVSGPNGTFYTQVFGAYPDRGTAPSAPTKLAATAATTKARFSWGAAKPNGEKIQKYVVVLQNTRTDGVRRISTTATSLAVGSLKPGTKYVVYVRAKNTVGWSPKSTRIAITTRK